MVSSGKNVRDDIFKDVEFDDPFWVMTRNAIQTSLATLPAVSWRPKLKFPSAQERASNANAIREARRSAIEVIGPSTEATMRAFSHTLAKNEWPDLTAQQVWNLTIALEQIVRFLDLCSVPIGQQNLTLFRGAQPDRAGKVILWFYSEWWYGVGLLRWLEDVTRDEEAFYLYFDRP